MDSLRDYQHDLAAIEAANNDPEDTMFVQLTLKDVCCIAFGLKTALRLFPELEEPFTELARKVNEVSDAQEFFDRE